MGPGPIHGRPGSPMQSSGVEACERRRAGGRPRRGRESTGLAGWAPPSALRVTKRVNQGSAHGIGCIEPGPVLAHRACFRIKATPDSMQTRAAELADWTWTTGGAQSRSMTARSSPGGCPRAHRTPTTGKIRVDPRSASRPGLRRSPRDTSYRTGDATKEGLPSLVPPGKRPLESPILQAPRLQVRPLRSSSLDPLAEPPACAPQTET
jgi:hypothetical protein